MGKAMSKYGWRDPDTGEVIINPLRLYLQRRESYLPDISELMKRLPAPGEHWTAYARRLRAERVGNRKRTVEQVTVLINLTMGFDWSVDTVYNALLDDAKRERRHQQLLRAGKRYRERHHREILERQRARNKRIRDENASKDS